MSVDGTGNNVPPNGGIPEDYGEVQPKGTPPTAKAKIDIQNIQFIEDGPNRWVITGEVKDKGGNSYMLTITSNQSKEAAKELLHKHGEKAIVACVVAAGPIQLIGENFDQMQKGKWEGANIKYAGKIKTIPDTPQEIIQQAKEKITQKQKFYQNPELEKFCGKLNNKSTENLFSDPAMTYAELAAHVQENGLRRDDPIFEKLWKHLECEDHEEARRILEKFFDKKVPKKADIEERILKWADEGRKHKNVETAMKLIGFVPVNAPSRKREPAVLPYPTPSSLVDREEVEVTEQTDRDFDVGEDTPLEALGTTSKKETLDPNLEEIRRMIEDARPLTIGSSESTKLDTEAVDALMRKVIDLKEEQIEKLRLEDLRFILDHCEDSSFYKEIQENKDQKNAFEKFIEKIEARIDLLESGSAI